MVRSIVVGTDGSPPANAALEEAIDLARSEGARLHIVTAYPDPSGFKEYVASSSHEVHPDLATVAENLLARAAETARAAGVTADTHDREDDPAHAILAVAREQGADMIMVGDRGLRGITRFLLGGVSTKVVNHADCSVTVVRRPTGAGAPAAS